MEKLSFLIFDLDDTLIHSNIDYSSMKKGIINLFNTQENELSSLTIKELLEKLSQNKEKFNHAYEIIDKIESNSALNAETISYADEIPSFLNEFNLKAAILTNNSRASVNKYLENPKFHYLKEIGSIITRDDVSKMKPDPAGLLYILNKFKANKEEVYFIGDSYIDAEAADKAHIKFLLFNSRDLPIERFNNPPEQIFSQLADVISFLRSKLNS